MITKETEVVYKGQVLGTIPVEIPENLDELVKTAGEDFVYNSGVSRILANAKQNYRNKVLNKPTKKELKDKAWESFTIEEIQSCLNDAAKFKQLLEERMAKIEAEWRPVVNLEEDDDEE